MRADISGRQFLWFYRWFKNYVSSFYKGKTDCQKEIIALKESHTLRVCQEITTIGRQLDLKLNELFLAKTIALFHDVGRFPQYERYGTFRDAKSVNHALLSIEVLKTYNVVKDLPAKIQEIIFEAIKYHNLKQLPEGLPTDIRFYSQLIRDADKLDVFYVFINYCQKPSSNQETVFLELPEKPGYSSQIIMDIMSNRISDLKFMQCRNDMKLLLLSWVFDINFKPTLKLIKQRQYVERIISFLPQTPEIDKVKTHLQNYLKKACQT